MAIEHRFASENYVNEIKNEIDQKSYSEDNPPPYPVTSVDGKTGDVSLNYETWIFTLDDGSTITKQVVVK